MRITGRNARATPRLVERRLVYALQQHLVAGETWDHIRVLSSYFVEQVQKTIHFGKVDIWNRASRQTIATS